MLNVTPGKDAVNRLNSPDFAAGPEVTRDAAFAAAAVVPRPVPAANVYLRAALPQIPRLLGMLDRNPFRKTYGSFDKQFWHYRTACFASEMYQEGVLPLALVYRHSLPGNRWRGNAELRNLILAGLRFSARNCHADGSCDDYYPYERALGAAVFSFAAATQACRLIEFTHRDADSAGILDWLNLRARWIASNGESGTLANHHALAALGLARMARLTGGRGHAAAAVARVWETLHLQHAEGWFCEYGGADPGYQTVTIDCLAKIQAIWRESPGDYADELAALEIALERGTRFCEHFPHPDGSYGGAYGSRGTLHFYPHGFELLAAGDSPAAQSAARLAAGFRRALVNDRIGHLADDRMFVHRLGNLIEAFVDAAHLRSVRTGSDEQAARTSHVSTASKPRPGNGIQFTHLPGAKLLIGRSEPGTVPEQATHTVISAARGGVFAHHAGGTNSADQKRAHAVTGDAGLIVELADGRIAVSQTHNLEQESRFRQHASGTSQYSVRAPLCFVRFETVSPLKQAVLHLGILTVGRYCRTLVRRLLQQRVITGRRTAPIVLTRKFEFIPAREPGGYRLRVTDHVELSHPKIFVRRMGFGANFEAAYVAASGVFREGDLRPWAELDADLAELNAMRRVEIVREFGATVRTVPSRGVDLLSVHNAPRPRGVAA